MNTYNIRYTEDDASFSNITLQADSLEELGGYVLLEWAAEEFEVDYDDVYTDGYTVWQELGNGDQKVLLNQIEIREVA